MSKAFLRAGVEVFLSKELYVVDRQCADGVWALRNRATDRTIEKTISEILGLYEDGEFVFREAQLASLRDGRMRRTTGTEEPVDLASDPRASYRLKFVRKVLQLPMTQDVLEPVIKSLWASLSEEDQLDDAPPGWASVYRWVRAFRLSGSNTKALVGSDATRGNRTPRFPKEVLEICEDQIEKVYLTEERPTVTHVTALCHALVRKLNRTRLKDDALPAPTERLLNRLIALWSPFDIYRARYGRDAALKKFRNSTKVRSAAAILEHGEIDHTRLDVFAIDDETGVPLGRPWLTVLVDIHSRYVLGISISYEPPSRATVARCLRHAFLPKTHLRSKHPEIANEWKGYGVFAGVTMDGGLEFHSEEIERIFLELNIEATFAPRKTPWFKGKVERFQGTLNRGISAATPGKTFQGIVDKDDYDPTKHALVTASELEYVVQKWIVDVYHQKPHRALGCTPAQMWDQSAVVTQIPMVADPLRFDAIVGGSETRTLSHKGIEFSSLVYNSIELGDLRRSYGDRFEVEIRFNRSNLGSIIVLHPERRTPIRVPCLQMEYAEGLTEWQHKVCKRFAKERLKREDPDAYLEAFLEIHELVRADLQIGKAKGKTRERVARWTSGKAGPTSSQPAEPSDMPFEKVAKPRERTPRLVKSVASPKPDREADFPSESSIDFVIPKFKVRIEDRSAREQLSETSKTEN